MWGGKGALGALGDVYSLLSYTKYKKNAPKHFIFTQNLKIFPFPDQSLGGEGTSLSMPNPSTAPPHI